MSSLQPSFLPESVAAPEATPLMAQYLSVKARHVDCLVFFRLGDFYELFFEDALVASKALDIALTRRGQHAGQDVPMCGIPAHAYETYLARLIRAGHRVAVCEQTETPEEAKKRGGKSLVTRDVVRIVTPGTLTEDSLLDARAANPLACLVGLSEGYAVAWCDVASGRIQAQGVESADLQALLARIEGSEILIPQKLIERPELFETLAPWKAKLVVQPNGRFDSENAKRRVQAVYGVQELDSFGDFSRVEVTALGALLDYVALTQKTDLKHFMRPQKTQKNCMAIDASTRRNLELTRTLSGERRGSLLDAIDRTETGAGARLLAARLAAPLTDAAEINMRLDGVQFFVQATGVRESVRAALHQTPDLERALARLSLGRGGPRDLAAVRDALKQAEMIRSALLAAPNAPESVRGDLRLLGEQNALIDKLERALAATLPMLARDGNFIARGYAAPLDELMSLRDDGKRLIAGLQQKYASLSGVPTLKIKHNQVIGYHIDVTPVQADRLLADKTTFIHRQTLASSARFTTVELSEMERKITESADRAFAMELEIFAALVQDVTLRTEDLRRTSHALASLDVASALAAMAVEQDYVRPTVDETLAFDIEGGRHPVVEQALKRGGGVGGASSFIANDCCLAPEQRLWLLTGPNMAGKSTFLRQNALIALLAQTGSFVPARAAHIGVVDRLSSRVGAADDLAAGRSTFMVEMVETAAILSQSTERSLVILDEIGRGTATYDGLSIAWAVLEHLHEVNRCRALFATHYHELTALTGELSALYAVTMRIKEWNKAIIFLHEVIAGTADRSYGIHVAQMAGLPAPTLTRAQQVLTELEQKGESRKNLAAALPSYGASVPQPQEPDSELRTFLSTLDPDSLAPREALEMLYKLKNLKDF